MVIGGGRSGKTTTIDAMLNYIFGVQYENKFRFTRANKSDNGINGTECINYISIPNFAGSTLSHSLNIIDTPGVGYKDRDPVVKKHICELLQRDGELMLQSLDAVCFVVPKSMANITGIQTEIFDFLLGMFGKDLRHHMFLLLTHAYPEEPLVIKTVEENNLPFEKILQFNHASLFDSENDIHESCWKMGQESLHSIFSFLSQDVSVSLSLTRDVLQKKSKLEIEREALVEIIYEDLALVVKLETEENALRKCNSDMRDFQFFAKTENVKSVVQKSITQKNALNCTHCEKTCHHPCGQHTDIKGCFLFKANVFCRECECHYKVHSMDKHIYETIMTEIEDVDEDKKILYDKAKTARDKQIDECNSLKNKLRDKRHEIMRRIATINDGVDDVNKCSFRSVTDFVQGLIKSLIEMENVKREFGFRQRIHELEKMKEY